MGYRYDDLAPGEIYHVFTRSVEQRPVFLDKVDHERFISLLIHCLPPGPIRSFSISQRIKQVASLTLEGKGLVDLLCYCMMPNHIHLLIRENVEGGTSLYMQRVLTGYARYFNIRRRRSGSLFIHPFKAVLVNRDEQLLHVSRYIHLNPYAAHITNAVHGYPWSSLGEYVTKRPRSIRSHRNLIMSMMTPLQYQAFVEDEADFARSLADIKHLLVENEV